MAKTVTLACFMMFLKEKYKFANLKLDLIEKTVFQKLFLSVRTSTPVKLKRTEKRNERMKKKKNE